MVRFNPAPIVRRAGVRQQDAITCLTREHDVIRKLFRDYERLAAQGGTHEQKGEIAGQICFIWSVHMQLEEEIFYPAVTALLGPSARQQHALDDHKGSRDLVAMLDELEPGHTDFDAAVAVLAAYVLPHLDEEEGSLFPEASRLGLDIELLGQAMALRRRMLMGDITRASPSLAGAASVHAQA